jgi:hypothetical protein
MANPISWKIQNWNVNSIQGETDYYRYGIDNCTAYLPYPEPFALQSGFYCAEQPHSFLKKHLDFKSLPIKEHQFYK